MTRFNAPGWLAVFLLLLVLSGCAQRATLKGASPSPAEPAVAAGGVVTFEAKPEWFACSTVADCVQTTSPCGGPSAVGRQFQAAYEPFVRDIAPQIDCQPMGKQLPFKVDCVNQRCAVVTDSE